MKIFGVIIILLDCIFCIRKGYRLWKTQRETPKSFIISLSGIFFIWTFVLLVGAAFLFLDSKL